MLRRLRDAGLVWPTLLALPALALLIGLGTWQLQRKMWKDDLIALIGERVKAPAVEIGPAFDWGWGQPPASVEYTRIKLAGSFMHGQERHLYALSSDGPGWYVITPMVLDDGKVVLVNRGSVPDTLKQSSRRPQGQVEGRVEVTGLLRLPEEKGMFTPANDPRRNIWFWRDVAALLRCDTSAPGAQVDCQALAGIGGAGIGKPLLGAYPFVVDAEAASANPDGWPRGGTTKLTLPNRHLEYAVTWYGLAATLVGVYLAFAVGRLRQGNSGK